MENFQISYFCIDSWEVGIEETGRLFAVAPFQFNYEKNGELDLDANDAFILHFENNLEVERTWFFETEDFTENEQDKIKARVLDLLEKRNMFHILPLILEHFPKLYGTVELYDISHNAVNLMPEMTEYWFGIYGIPAKCKINARENRITCTQMVFHEYPKSPVVLCVQDHFLPYFKEKSKWRLQFLLHNH